MSRGPLMREMTLYGVSFEPIGKQPIVLLKTADDDKFLPIWIGHAEAAAILMKLQGAAAPRPMTHDLLTNVISELQGEVVKVTVTELRENTFYASITIVQNGREVDIDSRTSDAIALAVRCDAQIFAAEEVIDESGIDFQAEDEEQPGLVTVSSLSDLDPAEFRQFLETVTVEDFLTSLEEPEDERRGRGRRRRGRGRGRARVGRVSSAADAGDGEDQRRPVERRVQEHRGIDAVRAPAKPADGEAEEGQDRKRDEQAVREPEQQSGDNDRERRAIGGE